MYENLRPQKSLFFAVRFVDPSGSCDRAVSSLERGGFSVFRTEVKFCRASRQKEVEETVGGHHSRKKLDLTGQRFGSLTVLCPAENIGTRTAWRCRCDCGRVVDVRTRCLRGGYAKSCGCLKPDAVPKGGLVLNYVDGTCVEMLQAKTVRSNNTSGVTGVEWVPGKQRWRATICFKGKRYYLGAFGQFDEAVKARKLGEEKFHDQFLREFASAAKAAAHG